MRSDRTPLTERFDLDRRPLIGASVEVVLGTYESWRADRTIRLGAGLAYYTLFAVVPFFALTAALAEQFFGLIDIAGYLSERLDQFGITEAELAGESLAFELTDRSTSATLGVIGASSLLFAASLVFLALVDAINAIWNVPVSSGLRNTVRRRLISFAMVLVTGAVLVAALAISTVSGAIERLFPGTFELANTLSQLLDWSISALTLGVALTLLFRYVGPVRAPWRPTIAAAVATSFLMVIGAQTIGWYLTTFGGASLGGAFGAVLAVLSWVYYEAQILLGGVQLTKVLTLRRDAGIDEENRDAAIEPVSG